MNITKATELAHALYRAHGDKAEAEAAQRKQQSEDAGNAADAAQWRTIQQQIRQFRGANQS